MKDHEVMRGLLNIYNQVVRLQENPTKDTITVLNKHIAESQALLLQYDVTPENNNRVAGAILKMVEAEMAAYKYTEDHGGTFSLPDLQLVFRVYKLAIETFFM